MIEQTRQDPRRAELHQLQDACEIEKSRNAQRDARHLIIYDHLHLGDHTVTLDGRLEPAHLAMDPISR